MAKKKITKLKTLAKKMAKPVAPPPAPDLAPDTYPYIAQDKEGRTCLALMFTKEGIRCIPMDSASLRLFVWPQATFERRFKPITGYDVKQGIANYVKHARLVGAQVPVIEALQKLAGFSEFDRQLMMARNVVRSPGEEKNIPKTVQTNNEGGSMKKVKVAGAPRESASAMFQELIMEGKLTDDQIFAKVKEKFHLDPKKRTYVAWYRNHLKKSGKKPPEPKGGAPAKAKGSTPGAVKSSAQEARESLKKKGDKKPVKKK